MILPIQALNLTSVLEGEWFEKIIEVRQVTKVGKGKNRISFRVIIVIGNKTGQVGIGIGKDTDLVNAKFKAISNAKKNIINIFLRHYITIPHKLFGKFKKSVVFLKPALAGTGIRAGQTIRAISQLVGLKNISAKQLGSNNVLNNAYATIAALTYLN